MKRSPKAPDAARWRELIHQHLLGTISNEESVELEIVLTTNHEAREDFRQRCNIDAALRQQAAVQMETIEPSIKKLTRIRLFPTLTAAAAGLVFGIFCTSMVWAYVVPYDSKAMTLLRESFESGPAPLVTGIPIKAGSWGGDFTEVVGEQQGVKPESGKKMLRFLRADFEGKAKPEGSYISEVHQLIDLRPYRREFADGGAVVQLSAAFNAFSFPAEEAFVCSVSLQTLDAETAINGSTRIGETLLIDCLAMARNSRQLDRDPESWQRLNAELRLPPNADFILIRIALAHTNKAQRRETFDGHYLDSVRLTLARRAPLP